MTSGNPATDIKRELHFVFGERDCFVILRRYLNWSKGHADRLERKPCVSTNGDYLDGWYSPERHSPEFVTDTQDAIIRHRIQFGEWPKVTRTRTVTENYTLENR